MIIINSYYVYNVQVPITVHFDHGSSKQELMEVLELVIQLYKCYLYSLKQQNSSPDSATKL